MTVVDWDARSGALYVLVDPRDGEIRYVGQTIMAPEQRLQKREASFDHRAKIAASRLMDRRACSGCDRTFNAGNLVRHRKASGH